MALILWASDLVQWKPNFWRPRACEVIAAAGSLIGSFWSSPGNFATAYAVGVADVTPAQQAALDAQSPIWSHALAEARTLTVGQLAGPERTQLRLQVTRLGLTSPPNGELIEAVIKRVVDLAAGHSSLLSAIDHWLDNMAVNAALAISGGSGTVMRPPRRRRWWCAECRQFHGRPITGGSVVFTDAFTVASDTNIDAYPSGTPDYAYNNRSGSDLTVNATNDRVQCPSAGIDPIARIIRAGLPTGNQEITATCNNSTSGADDTGNVIVRLATDGSTKGYVSYRTSGPRIDIYKITAGPTFTQMGTGSSASVNGSATIRLKATGTTTTTVEVQVNALSTYVAPADTSTPHQSGVPGIHIYNNNTNVGWVDNISVDDLAGGATAIPTADSPVLAIAESYRAAVALTVAEY
jgi:hypothetical protein